METVNTLWFGDRLRYLEQLSIISALKTGHTLQLFSYDHKHLAGVPDGVVVRDAREVMSDPKRTKLLDGKFKALGSDFFRYELFEKKLGYWMDLDVILLKQLSFKDEHVFGWENEGKSINGAVLRLPRGPILDELRSIPEENWCPPFFGPKRRMRYHWDKIKKGSVKLEDLPWGSAGPAMITYLARKYDVMERAQAKEVFYPVPYESAHSLFADASIVESLLRPNSVAIHMWNSKLRDAIDRPPPVGSYIWKMCRELGVRWD